MTPIVSKSVGRVKLLGRTDWNTDFIVNKPYNSYKFFFTANSSDPGARYPIPSEAVWVYDVDQSHVRSRRAN